MINCNFCFVFVSVADKIYCSTFPWTFLLFTDLSRGKYTNTEMKIIATQTLCSLNFYIAKFIAMEILLKEGNRENSKMVKFRWDKQNVRSLLKISNRKVTRRNISFSVNFIKSRVGIFLSRNRSSCINQSKKKIRIRAAVASQSQLDGEVYSQSVFTTLEKKTYIRFGSKWKRLRIGAKNIPRCIIWIAVNCS